MHALKQTDIAKKMQALQVVSAVPEHAFASPEALSQYVQLVQVDTPTPGAGQVLIKVSRGTINPNDLYHLKGVYSSTQQIPFPRSVGFEGAGIVVAAGTGIIGNFRVGSRVAFYAQGMFAEYVLCNALDLIDIPKKVGFSSAACSVANPMTSLIMTEVAKASGSPYIINTAAASALSKLLIQQAHKAGIKVIGIVRKQEQVEVCKAAGAAHVLNSSDADFDQQLQNICAETKCSFAFDCIAGEMPETLLRALPDHGTVALYGYLSNGPISITPQLLFPAKQLQSFEIDVYLSRKSLASMFFMARAISKGMGTEFRNTVQRSFPLNDAIQAISYYSQNMTAGKVQIIADELLL